jgi:hypothetical protein
MWKSLDLMYVFKKCFQGEGMPSLARLDLGFLVNFYWKYILKLLRWDFRNKLDVKKLMNKVGFQMVHLNRLGKLEKCS